MYIRSYRFSGRKVQSLNKYKSPAQNSNGESHNHVQTLSYKLKENI